MERIELGEEVQHHFVKNTLVDALDQWNHAIRGIREQLGDSDFALRELGSELFKDLETEKEIATAIADFQKRVNDQLQEVHLKATDASLLNLGGISFY